MRHGVGTTRCKSIYCDGPLCCTHPVKTMPHFLGNILQDKRSAAQHPEASNRSFDYSAAEKHDLIKQLPDLPIRFEHSEKLGDVGKIKSAFQDPNGRVWVIGEISDDGIAGKFVSKTIASRQHIGLSLGHEHTEYSDGSTRKRGLEVSICKEPRRPGCGVAVAVHASSRHYKRGAPDAATTTMTQTENSTEQQQQQTTTAKDTDNTPKAETDVDDVPALPPQEQLAEQVMEFAEKARAAEAKIAELEAERNERIKAEKKAMEEENAARKTNAENLAKSVLEHVAKFQTPQGSTASPQSCADQERAIKSLMESHPKEVETVLQVAHLCSSRAAKLEAELEQEKLRAEQRQLRSQYHAAVHQATGVGSSHTTNAPSNEESHAVDVRASKRQRTGSSLLPQTAVAQRSRYDNLGIDCADVTSAYQQFSTMSGGSGSSVSRMDEIANIMNRQKRRGFC